MTEPTNVGFSAADLADTGQWRLIALISEEGMTACLRHSRAQAAPPAILFSNHWQDNGNNLLQKIENTVYDNPRLLDDYATEVIIQTPKALFVPSLLLDEIGIEEDLLGSVYPAEAEDIFTDNAHGMASEDKESCIYTLTPGLPAFLQRTLPGARISCHLSVLIEKFRHHTSEHTRIYADIRQKGADILAFNGKNLLSASVQPWESTADIAYRILLLMKSYNLGAENVEIRLSGLSDIKTELANILRKMIGYVVFNPEPSSVTEMGLPLPLAISLEK
ncbi:MAG: DUF3822 family protein [Muribaculaceae bacterium]|nr:DUF3822 family protein [Muribaculaceae bacterium]